MIKGFKGAFLATAAVAGLATTSAFAADLPYKAPVPVVAVPVWN